MEGIMFVVSRNPYASNDPVIMKLEVTQSFPNGYRMRHLSDNGVGELFTDEHNAFFGTEAEANRYVAMKADRAKREIQRIKKMALSVGLRVVE